MVQQLFGLEEQPYTEDDAEWDDFVAGHPQGSLLQTTGWARLKGRFGWSGTRVWLKKEGKLAAGAQILFRSRGFGLMRLGYIPHGPLVNWGNSEQVELLLNQIDHAAYQYRASLLKMEPHLWDSLFPAEAWAEKCRQFECLPHTDTIQPPRTIQIDLRGSEKEILARMKQKTRYNIRLAAKKDVVVRQGAATDLPAFSRMMRLTGQRNQFGVHAPEYYKAAFDIFAPENCALFIADYQDKPLAGVMTFACGKQAAYLYGASTNEERKRMPAYAVQWAAMRWAKERGCRYYDLWGVPDYPKEQLEAGFQSKNEGLWGVYRFKRGFGGELKRTVGAADRVYNNLSYRLYKWRRGANGNQDER